MGWTSDDDRHEGWVASVLSDGRTSEGYGPSGGVLVFPPASGPGAVPSAREEVPADQVIAWQGQCTCSWVAVPQWTRVDDPGAANRAGRLAWSPDALPPREVEDAIHAAWLTHVRESTERPAVAALRGVSLDDVMALWKVPSDREMWQRVAANGRADGNAERVQVAERALAELPDVTAVECLQLGAYLVDRITGWRWIAMRQAREEGASWADIGAALGMTRQAAWESYKRAIDRQREHAGDLPLHDHDRNAAAL